MLKQCTCVPGACDPLSDVLSQELDEGRERRRAQDWAEGAQKYAEAAAASEAAAGASAEAAAKSEAAVEAAADSASKAAETAAGSAAAAEAAAGAAAGSEAGAEGWARLAESWAVGGTGTREGEETDNAKYYAGQAETSRAEAAGAAGAAAASERNAADSESAAFASAGAAGASAAAAKADAAAAAESREAARASETAAGQSEAQARDLTARAEAAAGSAGTSAEAAKEAADRAQSIGQGALGYYPTESDLRKGHAAGENGQWAIVGSTDTIWVWDEDAPDWTNSGNKTDLSNYYTKEQTDTKLDETQAAIDAALEQTMQDLIAAMAAARAEALGKVLYLYSAALTAEGWTGSDETGYTQTAQCTPQDGGPAVTPATQLGAPLARLTGDKEADEAMLAALWIINAGTVVLGDGTATVRVWEKPETETTVFWYGR